MSEAVELALAETIIATMQEEFPALDAYDEDEIASFEAKVGELIRAALTIPEGEPVAWYCTYPTYGHLTMKRYEAEQAEHDGARIQPLYTRPPVWPDREAVARVLFPHIYPQTAQLLDYDQVRAGLALGSMGGGMDDLNAATDAVIALLSASDGAGQVEGENP